MNHVLPTAKAGGFQPALTLVAGQLADAKTEHEWLKVAPSHILQQALKDLERACKVGLCWQLRPRPGRVR